MTYADRLALRAFLTECRNTLAVLYHLRDEFRPGAEGSLIVVLTNMRERIFSAEVQLPHGMVDRMTASATEWSPAWRCPVSDWIAEVEAATNRRVFMQ